MFILPYSLGIFFYEELCNSPISYFFMASQECFDELEKYTYVGFIQIIIKKILRNRNKYIINE